MSFFPFLFPLEPLNKYVENGCQINTVLYSTTSGFQPHQKKREVIYLYSIQLSYYSGVQGRRPRASFTSMGWDWPFDGDWNCVWENGDSAPMTVAQHAWTIFDADYALVVPSADAADAGARTYFDWADGTRQTLHTDQYDEGLGYRVVVWTTTHEHYPTIRWEMRGQA